MSNDNWQMAVATEQIRSFAKDVDLKTHGVLQLYRGEKHFGISIVNYLNDEPSIQMPEMGKQVWRGVKHIR